MQEAAEHEEADVEPPLMIESVTKFTKNNISLLTCGGTLATGTTGAGTGGTAIGGSKTGGGGGGGGGGDGYMILLLNNIHDVTYNSTYSSERWKCSILCSKVSPGHCRSHWNKRCRNRRSSYRRIKNRSRWWWWWWLYHPIVR